MVVGQAAGYYRFNVGDVEVICVNDGILASDINAVLGVPIEECRRKFEEARFPSRVLCTSNVFIIRAAGRTALVDTGSGPHYDCNSGKLFQNMAAAGVSIEDIDTILFTHIHPDHISGLLDADNHKVFARQRLRMARAEHEFWLSDAPRSKQIDHVKHEADYVIKFLAPYRSQIDLFEEGEVFPGVTAVPLPGHTPGHTGYRISSAGDELLIWGDVLHWPLVQFARPEAAMIYDVDPQRAVATRRSILSEAAASGTLVAGMHLFFPGLIRVRREADGFAMVPVPWGFSDWIDVV